MNCSNILSVISGYLDVLSLCEFRRVNRLFNKVSKMPEIWSTHFFKIFFGDLSIFGEIMTGDDSDSTKPIPDYYSLIQARNKFNYLWSKLPSDIISVQDLKELKTELLLTLKEPFLPPPSLRREGYYFPTTLQDLIGNAFVPPSGFDISYPFPCLDALINSIGLLESSFSDIHKFQKFENKRWLLMEKSTKSNDKVDKFQIRTEDILLELMKSFEKCIKLHCKAVGVWLHTCSDSLSFLSVYCTLFEAFAAAVHRLEGVMSSLSNVVNQIYDSKVRFDCRTPAYSVMRTMIIIWRRVILVPYREKIIKIILEILTRFRKSLINLVDFDEKQLDLLCKAVQCLIDLSVNELNIHFTSHTGFKSEGVYGMLDQAVITYSKEFYEGIKELKVKNVEKILKADLQVLQRAFLPCTWIEAKKNSFSLQIDLIKKHFTELFDEYHIEDSDIEPQPLLDTAFAKMLFDHKPIFGIKGKIKVFVKYLISSGYIEEIIKFNDLVEELEMICSGKLIQDEEIEYKNKELDLFIKGDIEEELLFSIEKDIGNKDFLSIAARAIN